MMEEVHTLYKNETWDIVDHPKGKRIVGCKWLYTLKYNHNGINYKARLVTKGFTQSYRCTTMKVSHLW